MNAHVTKFFSKKNLLTSVFFLLLIVVATVLLINRQKKINLLEESAYDAGKYNLLWPIPEMAGLPNGYAMRVALDVEASIGHIPYNDLIIRAWSYGYYKDQKGKLQKVAIPRVWESSTTKQVYFLGTTTPPRLIEGYTDKFLVNHLDSLNKAIFTDKKPLVTIFMAPTDPDQGPMFLSFYKTLADTKLPKSFIETGSTKDLPDESRIGVFLPATQLMADISKQ